ncbi:hypothetical protein N7522_004930 [Penicillium canescens]|uniref:Uncharacterized protein n=1 Tax=Penicillium canescens TaxID=5083 RepID=A0AAD6I0J9_PENCN|nr:uncharacterized protein N7446_004818 [Penicillium canescens]KAJ6009914.1 hypothetical protein N7522_004930 [Penicillium canescens]KAJ6026581.1 hypothetical protein N7460_011398 [Penicillium canescens]KAJ6039865.1 hypothetical protein N7444_008770 [Penicillium canescens]KAJ6067781.1 hypothetical protein N7446_004818 [Penicillium canescens]
MKSGGLVLFLSMTLLALASPVPKDDDGGLAGERNILVDRNPQVWGDLERKAEDIVTRDVAATNAADSSDHGGPGGYGGGHGGGGYGGGYGGGGYGGGGYGGGGRGNGGHGGGGWGGRGGGWGGRGGGW